MEFMISLSDVEKARSIAERYKVLIHEQFFLQRQELMLCLLSCNETRVD